MEPYELIRSRRKTLAIEITRDCRVLVRAPLGCTAGTIEEFVKSHEGWIQKHLAKTRERAASEPRAESREELRAMAERTRDRVVPRVEYWSGVMGLHPAGITITSARTRYGSCSAKNRLSFSCFLADAPDAALDLVVVHELCHIRVRNHGPHFYDLLSRYLPDYKERRRLLTNPAAWNSGGDGEEKL